MRTKAFLRRHTTDGKSPLKHFELTNQYNQPRLSLEYEKPTGLFFRPDPTTALANTHPIPPHARVLARGPSLAIATNTEHYVQNIHAAGTRLSSNDRSQQDTNTDATPADFNAPTPVAIPEEAQNKLTRFIVGAFSQYEIHLLVLEHYPSLAEQFPKFTNKRPIDYVKEFATTLIKTGAVDAKLISLLKAERNRRIPEIVEIERLLG